MMCLRTCSKALCHGEHVRGLQLDHVVLIAHSDLCDMLQRRACFHWSKCAIGTVKLPPVCSLLMTCCHRNCLQVFMSMGMSHNRKPSASRGLQLSTALGICALCLLQSNMQPVAGQSAPRPRSRPAGCVRCLRIRACHAVVRLLQGRLIEGRNCGMLRSFGASSSSSMSDICLRVFGTHRRLETLLVESWCCARSAVRCGSSACSCQHLLPSAAAARSGSASGMLPAQPPMLHVHAAEDSTLRAGGRGVGCRAAAVGGPVRPHHAAALRLNKRHGGSRTIARHVRMPKQRAQPAVRGHEACLQRVIGGMRQVVAKTPGAVLDCESQSALGSRLCDMP